MPTYKVYCYHVVEAAVVELEASSHDVACEVALELFDHPEVHFEELADPLDLALKAPLDTVVGSAIMAEEEESPWPVD
jgi:hypothetical protein